MKIKLNKLMAGPGGCFPPGSVLELPDETAMLLVADGAEMIAPPAEVVVDVPAEPEREEAAEHELETDHGTGKRAGVRGRRKGAGAD